MKIIYILLCLFTSNTYAESKYDIDSKSSFALFKILKKNYPSPSYGQFPSVNGVFELGSKGEIKSCALNIKTNLVSSGRLKQDEFIRGKELFFVKKYPEIKVTCLKFLKKNETQYSGELELELKGKKVLVKSVVGRKIRDRLGEDWVSKKRQGLDFRFVVNRSTFGMKKESVYKYGKKLELVISVEGLRK